MPNDKTIQILLGLVTSISIALASFSLKWVFDANAEIKTMKTTSMLQFEKMSEILELKFADIEDSLLTLGDDTDDMTRLSKQISKHWKLHTWSKDQIAELRHKSQLEPVSWPDLD